MILAFKQQFKEPILNGTKIHTIQKDPTRRWRAGKLIHMATGVRTKHYDCFNETICTECQEVFMSIGQGQLSISIDDRELFGLPEREEFAISDGFKSWDQFVEWFYPICQANDNVYSSVLIHWTNKWY